MLDMSMGRDVENGVWEGEGEGEGIKGERGKGRKRVNEGRGMRETRYFGVRIKA